MVLDRIDRALNWAASRGSGFADSMVRGVPTGGYFSSWRKGEARRFVETVSEGGGQRMPKMTSALGVSRGQAAVAAYGEHGGDGRYGNLGATSSNERCG